MLSHGQTCLNRTKKGKMMCEVNCTNCRVSAFKHGLCPDDFCEKHKALGTEDDFIRTLQPEQGDEAIFWKKRAREYEDIIADLVAEQAKGIKFDSITITEEGITFKKPQPERTGKWTYVTDGYVDYFKCDMCGKPVFADTPYCPNCGARMEP